MANKLKIGATRIKGNCSYKIKAAYYPLYEL